MVSKAAAEASAKNQGKDKAQEKEIKKATREVKNALKYGRSPKIQAMLDAIDDMAPDSKGVIFSQWTSLLDIIEVEFQREGHTFTRIDGKMPMQDRIDAMDAFDTQGCDSNRTPRFILCSLMACGTGINLTRGNVVFLLDPWWNAAAEAQAMDRVSVKQIHRRRAAPCQMIVPMIIFTHHCSFFFIRCIASAKSVL